MILRFIWIFMGIPERKICSSLDLLIISLNLSTINVECCPKYLQVLHPFSDTLVAAMIYHMRKKIRQGQLC